MTTLLLAPPSRREHDVAISLRAPAGDPAVAEFVATAAMGSNCPPAKAERVRTCILHSGRYDCRVSFLLAQPALLDTLRSTLATRGAAILVLNEHGDPADPPSQPNTSSPIRWAIESSNRRRAA